MTGVHYADGIIEATDAHVLVRYKGTYPKYYEGKIIRKDGSTVEGRYPNVLGVIPDKSKMDPYQVDVNELVNLYRDALKKNRDLKNSCKNRYQRDNILDWQDRKTIMFYDPYDPSDPRYQNDITGRVALSIEIVPKLIHYLQAAKTDTIWLNKYESTHKPVVAYGNDSVALFMPSTRYSYESHSEDIDSEYKIQIRPNAWRRETSKVKAKKDVKPKKEKPKTDTTMRKTTTRRKTAARKSTGGNTIARAASILRGQKKEYQRIFKSEVKKKGVDSKKAAVKAGSIYRKKYGSTAKARWKNAISTAKRFERS